MLALAQRLTSFFSFSLHAHCWLVNLPGAHLRDQRTFKHKSTSVWNANDNANAEQQRGGRGWEGRAEQTERITRVWCEISLRQDLTAGIFSF